MPSLTAPHARILVTLDGSARSADAVPVGDALADRFQVPVSYLTVAARPVDVAAAADACTEFVSGERLEVVVADDVPGTILAADHGERGPALRCMASHGRGALRGHLLGSVAEEVIRRGVIPTVLVGPSFDARTFTGIDRLVVCTDGSATSDHVVPIARGWARLGVGLEFVTVHPHARWPQVDPVRPRGTAAHHARVAEDEAAHVRRLAQRSTDDGPVRPGWHVLHDDDAANALTEHVKHRPGSLLAMHTHGLHGPRRRRFGRTTLRVIRSSRVPILLTGPGMAAHGPG